MSEKVYVGNAKIITTQYGDLTKISLTAEDVEKLQGCLDNGWVNVVIKERREPSATGFTHYLEVDTWKPEVKDDAPDKKSVEVQPEDLPF